MRGGARSNKRTISAHICSLRLWLAKVANLSTDQESACCALRFCCQSFASNAQLSNSALSGLCRLLSRSVVPQSSSGAELILFLWHLMSEQATAFVTRVTRANVRHSDVTRAFSQLPMLMLFVCSFATKCYVCSKNVKAVVTCRSSFMSLHLATSHPGFCKT